MTNSEFKTWLEFHCKAFGDGLRQWIAKEGDDAVSMWFSALYWQTLDEAKAATETMFSNEDQQPQGWSKHPARLNKITRESREDSYSPARQDRKFIDGQEVFDCNPCEDIGIRTIVNKRNGKPAKTAVACVCHHGNRWSKHKNRRWRLPVFNDRWMIEELADGDKRLQHATESTEPRLESTSIVNTRDGNQRRTLEAKFRHF